MSLELSIPHKPTTPFQVASRVSEENKKYLERICKQTNRSEADVIHQMIDQFRQIDHDSNKGKSRRNN